MVVGVLLLLAIGGIIVAYKFLMSRKAPNGRTGRPEETPRKSVSEQKPVVCMVFIYRCTHELICVNELTSFPDIPRKTRIVA